MKGKDIRTPIILLLVSLCVALGATEVCLRHFFSDRLSYPRDERNLTYRYDAELGWFPKENQSTHYKGSREIEVHHNSRGFRDPEPPGDGKPAILFMGDSFVWGYDVEQSERFTDLLRKRLTNWDVYNLGVSGYGTDQEYLLLTKEMDFYRPRIVVLVFCRENDESDNSKNMVYGGYYKPYFKVVPNGLVLEGVPVPKSANYFFANHPVLSSSYCFRLLALSYFRFNSPPPLVLDNPTPQLFDLFIKLVQSRGAKLIVASTLPYPGLASFLAGRGVDFINLDNPYRFPSHGFHWTPKGHKVVSDRIFNFLTRKGYLSASGSPGND